jgi:hypothetical protein
MRLTASISVVALAVAGATRASDVPAEGTQDDLELITEAQVHLRPNVVLKLNNALGLSSKATDWAPEIGVLFSFR